MGVNSQPDLTAINFEFSLMEMEVAKESRWKLAKIQTPRGHDNSTENGGIPCDLNSKLLHLAWHPTTNLIACAVANSLYLYYNP
ncbi:hypothetical protein C5167_023441 [Papaver somniferum]|uniref:Uncharacterized protein n=1 Tax=Papaver somniferum TaxID=3469 RepID=A0A4Y7JKQ6_PAPSO|nr:hypothetical protein C5167_023441 [Papaver somniferum]